MLHMQQGSVKLSLHSLGLQTRMHYGELVLNNSGHPGWVQAVSLTGPLAAGLPLMIIKATLPPPWEAGKGKGRSSLARVLTSYSDVKAG